MKARITVLFLILSGLACMTQVETPVPVIPTTTEAVTVQPSRTVNPNPSPSETSTVRHDTAIVRVATVNVHDTPGGTVTGYVSGGDTVVVLNCSGDWCKIANPVGYVWRGCLSGNEDRGCEAK